MAVVKTLNLVDCANKADWEEVLKKKAVSDVATSSELPAVLRAQVLSVGVTGFSRELRAVRASERSMPESLLLMKLR